MTVDLAELKSELESRKTDDVFNKEISSALDATIILMEYLEKHPNLVRKVPS